MKQRAAEIIFKHKVLILLPMAIILPLTVFVATRPRPQKWQATVRVWVDQYQQLYSDSRVAGWSPAGEQATLLTDFLGSREFQRKVIAQTSLAAELDDPDREAGALWLLSRSVGVAATSSKMLTIYVTTEYPQLSQEIAQAVETVYQDQLAERLEEQTAQASQLYADELAKAEDALNKARRDVAAYVTAHPELGRLDASSTIAASRDPAYARLLSQLQYSESKYNTARANDEKNQELAAAGKAGQPFSFTVIDSPELPRYPQPVSKLSLIKLPAIGFALGALLSSGIAALLVLTSHSVFGRYDAEPAFGLPLLGEVPELRRRWLPWQRRPRQWVRLGLLGPARMENFRAP